jgi:hypothetical protein
MEGVSKEGPRHTVASVGGRIELWIGTYAGTHAFGDRSRQPQGSQCWHNSHATNDGSKYWSCLDCVWGVNLGFTSPTNPLLPGLALTVGCVASFGCALWVMFSWKPRVGLFALLILLAAGVGFYWWQDSTHVLDFPKWPIPHLPPGVVPTIRR